MNFNFKNFYNRNFVFRRKKKLSLFTIVFIMFLNIFVVLSFYYLIDTEHNLLNKPIKTYPQSCRSIVSNKSIENFNNYYFSMDYKDLKNIHPLCNTLLTKKLPAIQNEHNILELRKKERILNIKQKQVVKELNYLRENYYTVLYSELSDNAISRYIIIDNISLEKLKYEHDSLSTLNKEITKRKNILYEQFEKSKSFRDFRLFIRDNKGVILNNYINEMNSLKLKKNLMILFTLLPSIVLFFYLMKKYKRRGEYIYFLISKNIVLVLFFPLFFSFIFLCSELVPQNLVNKILDYNFPFFVYYISLFAIIFLLGVVTIRLQKKYHDDIVNFKKESISRIDSYYKNICNICVTPVDYKTMHTCPTCDNELKVTCPSCDSYTIKDLSYCVKCGENLKQEQFFTIKDF